MRHNAHNDTLPYPLPIPPAAGALSDRVCVCGRAQVLAEEGTIDHLHWCSHKASNTGWRLSLSSPTQACAGEHMEEDACIHSSSETGKAANFHAKRHMHMPEDSHTSSEQLPKA